MGEISEVSGGDDGRGEDRAVGVIDRGVAWLEEAGDSSGEDGRGDTDRSRGNAGRSVACGEPASEEAEAGWATTSWSRD